MEPTPQDPGPFAEYQQFDPPKGDEVEMSAREASNAAFRAGKATNPTFNYPQLDSESLSVRRSAYDAAIDAEADEAKRAVLKGRQRGVDIAMAAAGLKQANDLPDEPGKHAERWQAGQELVASGQEKYGGLRPELFWPVLAAKKKDLQQFRPGNLHAQMTVDKLQELIPETPEGTMENPILSRELLDKIRPSVMEYLEPILSVVPEEGEFSSDEIKVMCDQALANTGLAEEGWEGVIDSNTKLFSVKNSKKQVIIPGNTIKSAADIKRLFAHEIGIHAMRRDKSLGADFEEGMGLLMESVVTDSTDGVAIQRAENRYLHAGLAAGIDGVVRNARQVFEITWRLEAVKLAEHGIITPEIEEKAKKAVQPHIDNIFRGTDHRLPGVIYNKAKVYLEGVIEAAAFADENCGRPGWLPELVANGRKN